MLFLLHSEYPDCQYVIGNIFKMYFAREILSFKFVYFEPYLEKTQKFVTLLNAYNPYAVFLKEGRD